LAYEEKVDGWRMLAYQDGARVRLISRTAVDHTARFREPAAATAKLRPDTLVDIVQAGRQDVRRVVGGSFGRCRGVDRYSMI
jgi:ATP-dependent DNA ligase